MHASKKAAGAAAAAAGGGRASASSSSNSSSFDRSASSAGTGGRKRPRAGEEGSSGNGGDRHKGIERLFERCLVPCASYWWLWERYAMWKVRDTRRPVYVPGVWVTGPLWTAGGGGLERGTEVEGTARCLWGCWLPVPF